MALAQKLSHPFSVGYALINAAVVHVYRRENHATQERADEAMTLATEQGFPYHPAIVQQLRGAVLVALGEVEEGLTQIQQGVAAAQATGTKVGQVGNLLGLASAHAQVGQVEEGMRMVTEALVLVNKTGERLYEAPLYMAEGWLTLGSKKVESEKAKEEKAETCFRKAIEIAQRQQAKTWELRATMSLTRLWQSQGKIREARARLSHIYNWFTEGFDTKDLQEAKALLGELRQ